MKLELRKTWTVIEIVLLGAALVFILLFSCAKAQQPPQPYVPFIIDEQNYNQIYTYLNQQPAMFSRPLLNLLDALETKARADVAKSKEEKKE